ncbi:MAG: tetratricopeptide repeat protein [Candidatus Marinimicrobia bacterium]|nr:tetratricopeptide repeat protein [Candidatus Neomarinimicrobiota bacterium]
MKRKIYIGLLLTILLLPALFALDMDREQVFKQGVSAYVAEDYAKAISIFGKLEDSKEVSWELFFNLGNAYYRNGKLGNAIRYWEKAKLLVPSQTDVNHNLAIAEQLLIDKVVLPDMFPLFKWYAQMQKKLPLNITVLIIGFLLIVMIILLGFIRKTSKLQGKPRRASYVTVLAVFLSLILISSAITINTAHKRKNEKYAIILEREVNILSEPGKDATVLFILHEGSKVMINKNIEDSWSNISYFDDKIGWVQCSAIGEI